MTETTQTEQQQINPPKLNDGQTTNIPPLQPMELPPQPTTTVGFGDFYTKDEFFEQFKSVFQFAGDGLNIQTLPIQAHEEPGARVTSNRIYEMAEKYAFMRFMIDKRSTRFGETILMIQFLTSKAGAVYMEKRNRKLGVDVWQKIKKLFKRNKAKDTAYSGPAEAEKQQKPANS